MSENLVTIFFKQVDEQGDRVALKRKRDGEYRDITWREYGQCVQALAITLTDRGIDLGDRVAIFSYNSPEWAYADLATMTIRAIVVPIYFKSAAPQVEFILRDSEAKVIMVGDADQLDTVLSLKKNLPALKFIIAPDGIDSSSDATVLSFSEAMRKGADNFQEKISPLIDEIEGDDIATIVYTSGTTGEPKGVMLTHRNMISNVRSDMEIAQLSQDDVGLSFLPTSHVLDKVAVHYMSILAGGTLGYAESMDTILTDVQLIKPTAMCGVPRMFEKIYTAIFDNVNAGPALNKKLFSWAIAVGRRIISVRQNSKRPNPLLRFKYTLADKFIFKKIRALFGGRLRLFASGGSHLREDIDIFFRALGIPILHGFGLTEATCTVTINSFDDFRYETLGRPLPGVGVSIADDGEILVKGDLVMKGYYKRPDETAAVLRNGWLYTGDLGYLTEDGYLVMTDRKKELIKTSGSKYISPQRIETLLKLNRYVEQAVVVAEGRKFPSMLIVPSFEELKKFCSEKGLEYRGPHEAIEMSQIEELFQAIIDKVNENLDGFEQIKRFTLLPEELTVESGELTHTLKVKRRVIDQKYKDTINKMYQDS
jgi:long-chain acyl-CoA synthetase